MTLTSKHIRWCLWGIGAIAWLVVLIQVIPADTDTLIVNGTDSSSAITAPAHDRDSTAPVSPSQRDSVSIEKHIDTSPGKQETPSQKPASTEGCVNVNTAGKETLVTLSGIGPVLAERIIAYRQEQGPFSQAEDLVKVKGIGEKKLMKIRDRICF